MAETLLEIRHLSKAFGKNVVLKDIDFSVQKGDVTSIIGASGSKWKARESSCPGGRVDGGAP